MKKIVYFFSLFGSIGTLFCCALPVLFVSLGMGAVFASFTALFPQFHIFAEYKTALFIMTGGLLLSSYFLMRRAEVMECPIDDSQKNVCRSVKPKIGPIFFISLSVYGVGLIFAYILPLFF